MERALKLLDLYYCGGGAGAGYWLAGYDITGVDISPQPRYPFPFVQADAMEYLAEHWTEFDVIHASPPCQAYSEATRPYRDAGKTYPDLVAPTRELLEFIGKPYVIENVPGAPLINPVELCGSMFGLQTYRHRLFESNMNLQSLPHPSHRARSAKMGRVPQPGEFIQVVGHFSGLSFAQDAMEIDWLDRDSMSQAIPPAYTKFIGLQLISLLNLVL